MIDNLDYCTQVNHPEVINYEVDRHLLHFSV